MTTVLLLSLVARQEPSMADYTEKALGLTFQYPREWRLTRGRLFDEFEIPLDGGQRATVQVFRAAYRDSKETWQQVQSEVNRTLGRTVVNQWQEEILGVPLLLTKVAYKDQGADLVSVTGLLYTATVEKLQFRLTTRSSHSDSAERQWRQALVTLRTVSGELPPAEGPGIRPVVIEPPRPARILRPDDPTARRARGPVSRFWEADGRGFRVWLPQGWSLQDDGRLSGPGFSGMARFSVRQESREAAERSHAAHAREGLARFHAVRIRRDVAARRAESGALVWATFRDGDDGKGRLALGSWTFHADDVTWTVDYRSVTPEAIEADWRSLNHLARGLFAEPSP
jgi:hypothetical protein